MQEIIYTSESDLRLPRQFFRAMIFDLLSSRKVAWRLFLRNLRSQYRQSILGYFWVFLPPLLTASIWIFLSATKVLSFTTFNSSYVAFVLTGVFLWQTFIETLNCPLQQITYAKRIISKFRIPHEALILSGLGEIAFNLIIRMTVLIIVLIFFKINLSWTLLLVPFGIFSLLTLGLALGLLLTPIGLLYKDVTNGLGFALQVAFFLTPIIYPLPTEGIASVVVKLNPLTPLLVTTRDWLISGVAAPQPFFFCIFIASLFILAFGWITYRLAKPHIIERLSS